MERTSQRRLFPFFVEQRLNTELNMELDLQSLFQLFGLLCTAVINGLDPAGRSSPPPPAFGLIYEGAIGQPRYTTSRCNPLLEKDSKARTMLTIFQFYSLGRLGAS